MRFKHRVNINVSQTDGSDQQILRAADRWLPRRLIKWLFGDYQQIYLITPGKSISGIDIKEEEDKEVIYEA